MHIDPRHLLLMDAGLLIRQYRNRNLAGCQLDANQRRRWAAEAAVILERLGRELQSVVGEAQHRIETTNEWNQQLSAGRRFVSTKLQQPTGSPPHSDYPSNWPEGERRRWERLSERAREVMGYMPGAIWTHDRQPDLGWRSPGDLARESQDGLTKMLAELDRVAPTITPGTSQPPRRPGKRG